MTDADSASRHLRVIRSLMERATIYRSISAPTALVGGLLSLGGFITAYYAKHHRDHPLSPSEFLIVWLVILGLTGFTNLVFLSRGAALRGEPFFSSGMKCAFLSLAPAFFSAAVLTPLMSHHPIHLALVWITLYGMGLLATQHFAPRSIVILGLTFFLTGCGLLVAWKHLFMPDPHIEPSALVVSGIMAATFGGFHLAYAAAVWAIGEDRREPVPSTTGTENV
ncbi:MAG TPA: hypothetical protein VGZ93_07090 [Candidatus Methylacidiphilales bacterium]|jgi:hypothetical protein|nr:hypothetical protein [Candidatus Methylacidiphilales bacterium]